ncbi:uncharacterized protein BT62DRAFT_574802 [Guyanagaster necrorhizus]|uniref:Uncharacterized protein n=1 Tax=Guyanagaster necrorhizus TaxID=856835 RepID=A0A9P7VHE3_9AGAR|nr:uncharacterized protein BT62DRAFT_574802 [Guyanagaster necrorhizus MCA 3950]KAG7440642.1 hypothetical protein BT62DRAFT_574802 [Guyanagaster necrorhizus MCA 3950]
MVEDISFEPRLIKDIEVHDLGPSTKVLRLTLKVVVGGVVRSYRTISVKPDDIPRWLVNLNLDNIDMSTEVKLILYKRHPFWLEVLGSTEKTISDFSEEENDYKTFPIYHDNSTSPTIASFRISYSDDIRLVSVKTMMKDLREVNFVANVAWGFLSKGIDVSHSS